MQNFALGWRPNPVGSFSNTRAPRFAAQRLRANVEPLETCSLLRFDPRRLFQGSVGSCVAVGTKGMFLDWCAANGEEPFEVSERVLYWQARVLEYVDQGDTADDARELVALAGDTGAYPWLAFNAWKRLGLVPFELCPDAEPTSLEEVDRFVTVQPPPNAFAGGWTRRDLDTIEVDGVGLQKVRQLANLLRYRTPVGFGMTVDLGFMSNGGRVVEGVNHTLAQGGHWMRALAVLHSQAASAELHTVGDELELISRLRAYEIREPSEATTDSVVLYHNTWRGWGLANGMGMMRAGAWSQEARDVTGVEWLPAGD